MSTTFIIYIAVLGYIYFTIFFANHTDLYIRRMNSHDHTDTAYLATLDNRLAVMRTLLFIGVSFISLLVLFLLMTAYSSANADQLAQEGVIIPKIDAVPFMIGLLLTVTTTVIAYQTVASASFRMRIARRIRTYNPQSWVHQTAIIFILLLLTAQIILFITQGGVEAMAQSIERQGANVGDVLFQLWLQLIAAFLGVGWAIRRDWNSTLHRLGLRPPTRQDWIWGIGGGVGLLALLYVYGIVVGIIVTLFFPEQFDSVQALNRANDSIALAFSTLPLALLLSASAALGEEILFRGALQPIFGNLLISLFFTLLHVQTLFSPGILLLFGVSIGLGIIRNRASTTAAIMAHFMYNFAQLMLSMLIISEGF
ncbi:MAG: hypothetical protein CUN52_03005 [Phototrophicales bacterium]|nr:MAG: hypothetical protein CUN52_03005 [Phototrophicales bacterium]